jgi:hypothetical protein
MQKFRDAVAGAILLVGKSNHRDTKGIVENSA